MNNDAKPFKQAVSSYYRSKKMSAEKLQSLSALYGQFERENVSKKVKPTHRNRLRVWSYSASAIAASLIAAILFVSYQQQPELITAAYDDILKDANLNNGLAAQQKEWIAVNHIAPAPAEYKIEMSKFCELSGLKTTHLRIAGQLQGKVNIFFKKGPRPYRFGKTSGKKDSMYWKVLESKKDLTVILVYTEDMREKVVNNIINKMLPDLTA